jgi:Cold shock proteins
MLPGNQKTRKIGVFYDGNYFLHVSNYYNYVHPKKRRLSISGIHNFISRWVANVDGIDERLCLVVDAHYFRSRLNAQEASQRGSQLYYERVFDDILMSEGVTTHYLPVRNKFGRKEDRGVEVWLAMEALELGIHKMFDVVVLIASDGDYVPLVRKLNTLGIRVIILSWNFEFMDDSGQRMVTKTSQDLLSEASYPIQMNEIIDNEGNMMESMSNDLFVQTESSYSKKEELDYGDGPDKKSKILSLKEGFGFIGYPPNNLFFHYTDLIIDDFNDLREGDAVEFTVEKNERGQEVAKNIRKI